MIATYLTLVIVLVLSLVDLSTSFQVSRQTRSYHALLIRSNNHGLSSHAPLSTRSGITKPMAQYLKMTNSDDNDKSSIAIGASGVLFNIVCDYSLYVLKTTSCGLPPGPYGLLGALEGISYLGVVGIVAWSAVTKIKTGSGLPAGPAGLLGAAEGLSYLTVLAGIVIAGINVVDYGFLPGFLPNDKCFGIN